MISTARPTDQALVRLAQSIAARLPGASDLPAWTTALPPEVEVPPGNVLNTLLDFWSRNVAK